MSFICHHFFCHHKYTPYAHFCQFRFPFTSPLSLCTRKPHFTILNPFASARVNRPGTGTTKYGFSHSKPTPFQRYNFREDRRTPSADAPSAQRESIRVKTPTHSCHHTPHSACHCHWTWHCFRCRHHYLFFSGEELRVLTYYYCKLY